MKNAHAQRSALVAFLERHQVATILGFSCLVALASASYMYNARELCIDLKLMPAFPRLLLLEDFESIPYFIAIAILALSPTLQKLCLPLVALAARHPGRLAIGTFLVLSVGTLTVYRNHPVSMDEFAPFFQAQLLAHGNLTAHYPIDLIDRLVPPNFQQSFLVVSHDTGQVASSYWPGFALLLTPFMALGIPWACNPAISAISLLMLHRLAGKFSDDPAVPGWTLLFAICSPAFVFNGISYYSMPAHLLLNGAFALTLCGARTPRRLMLAGALGSLAFVLHNPLPHMLFATPWILWILARNDGLRNAAWLALGYLPGVLILGVGWKLLLASIPGGPQIVASHGAIGFVDAVARAFAFPDLRILESRLSAFYKLNLWAVPGLCALAIVGAARTWHRSEVRLASQSAILTSVGYLFVVYDQGHGWGYRYFHSTWLVLPLLASLALATDSNVTQTSQRFIDPRIPSQPLKSYLAALAVLTFLIGHGLRGVQIRSFIDELLANGPTEKSLRTVQIVLYDNRRCCIYDDLVHNDPFLTKRPIYMLSQGTERDALMLMKQFPDTKLLERNRWGTLWGIP